LIDWNTAFPVLSITRKTLKSAGITDAQMAFFTDAQMAELAQAVYVEGLHFIDGVLMTAREMLDSSFGKAYGVIAITRTSLKEAGISNEEIATLTDEDMEHIAEKVSACIDDEELLNHIYTGARNLLDFGNMAV